jgi:hypothetical protein
MNQQQTGSRRSFVIASSGLSFWRGWLAYFGITGIVTAHLDLGHSVRFNRRWFYGPLDGLPRCWLVFPFFASLRPSRPFARHIQRLTGACRRGCESPIGGFSQGWAVLYFAARFISHL